MAVLVTGASGFVGSWLARALIAQGEEVRVLHRPRSSLDELKGLTFVSCPGDVTDLDSVRAACRGVDTVFHLAGVVGYAKSMRKIMEDVNVGGTQNVLTGMIENSPNARLIYMSSVVAVGASRTPKALNEESPYTLERLNLGYFATKRAAEKLVVEACRAQRLQAIILNPSTIYGPGDAKKGSRKTQVKIAQGRVPFYTSGGVSIVSVHDVIQAILSARTQGRIGERYILAGENVTIHELVRGIAELAGVKPPGIYLPNFAVHTLGAVGDVLEKFNMKGPFTGETAWTTTLYHWFQHDKAKRDLAFNPRRAKDALAESVGWMKQNGMLG